MTKQDEKAKKELLGHLKGPNSSRNLAHNLALGPRIKDVGKEKNKLVTVLTRTFFVGFLDFPAVNPTKISPAGSAFALDYQGRQYLITASHVIKFPARHPGEKGRIYIWLNNAWNPLEVTVVGRGDANIVENDVAVLAADIPLPIPIRSSEESFEPSIDDISWGQRVYFCGFPYGNYTKTDVIEGYPMAMIKGAILSGMYTKSGTLTERERGLFVLDGINNGGFSGGPAVFRSREKRNADFQVFGVVSGYLTYETKVMCEGKETGDYIEENTGLIHCPSIMRAVDMIEAKPIGFEISRSIK